MATIGKWITQLTLDASQFTSGLKVAASQAAAAKQEIGGQASQIKDVLFNAAKGLTGVDLGGVFGQISGLVGQAAGGFSSLGSIGASALGSVASVGLGVVAGIGAVGAATLSAVKSIAALDTAAKRLQTTGSSLQGLAFTAELKGIDLGSLTGGLEMFGRHLGSMREQLAAGQLNEEARALRGLGIDINSIADIPIDQAFRQIAVALGGVTNANDRANMAQKIFGRQFREFMPLLSAGGKFFEDAQNRMDRFGLSLSNADFATVKQASVDMKAASSSVTSIVTSIMNSLAVGLSPVISAISRTISAAVEYLQPFLDVIRSVIRAVGVGIEFIVGLVGILFEPFRIVIESIVEAFSAAWQSVKGSFVGLYNTLKPIFVAIGKFWRAIAGGQGGTLSAALLPLRLTIQAIGLTISAVVQSISLVAEIMKPLFALIVEGIAKVFQFLSKLPSFLGGNYFADLAKGARDFADELQGMQNAASGPRKSDWQERLAQLRKDLQDEDRMIQAGAEGWKDFVQGQDRSVNTAVRMATMLEQIWRAGSPQNLSDSMAKAIQDNIQKQIDQLKDAALVDKWKSEGLSDHDIAILRLRNAGATGQMTEEMTAIQAIGRAMAGQRAAFEDRLKLQERIATFHMDQFDAENYRRMHDPMREMTEEMLDQTRELQNQVRYLDYMKQSYADAAQVANGLKSPFDKWIEKWAELKGLKDSGALTDDEFALGVTNAARDLEKAQVEQQTPRALLQGSVEAASAVNAAVRNAQGGADPLQRMLRIQESSHSMQVQQLQIARRFSDAVLGGDVLRTAEIPP